MKTSQLLRKAHRLLWSGGPRTYLRPVFICHAVARALGQWDYKDIPICREIEERLRPTAHFEDWLQRQGITTVVNGDLRPLQAHRKAWVKRLIAEYEAKGD